MWSPVLPSPTWMRPTKGGDGMKMVKICLPKAREGLEQELFVGVNGVGYRIRKGVEVEVPSSVAEVLAHADEADEANEAFLAAAWQKA